MELGAAERSDLDSEDRPQLGKAGGVDLFTPVVHCGCDSERRSDLTALSVVTDKSYHHVTPKSGRPRFRVGVEQQAPETKVPKNVTQGSTSLQLKHS